MQEIACPDAKREQHEERSVLDVPDGHNALPDASHGGSHLIIYCKASHYVPCEDADGDAADGCNGVSRGGEAGEDGVDVSAGAVEERREYVELEHYREQRDEHYERRVDGSLRHNGAESLRKRHSVIASQHSAACKLAHARHDEADSVGEEYGVDARRRTRLFA